MGDADKCFLLIPYKDGFRIIAQGDADETTYKTVADQMFQNFKAIENRINDPDCSGGETERDWVMFRTNAQQLISPSTSTTIENWDLSQTWTSGEGSSWPMNYTSGELTIPSGVYFTSGGGTWSSATAGAQFTIQARFQPITGIFIGTDSWAGDTGSFLQTFAGTDALITADPMTADFRVRQETAGDVNFDRMYWFVEKLQPLTGGGG